MWFFVLFFGINLLYSTVLKSFNQIVASMIMSVSIPLRVMLGVVVAHGVIWDYRLWYLLVWLGLFGYVLRKIQFERPLYSGYPLALIRQFVLFVCTLCAAVLFLQKNNLVILCIYVLYYLGGQIGYDLSPQIRQRFRSSWRT